MSDVNQNPSAAADGQGKKFVMTHELFDRLIKLAHVPRELGGRDVSHGAKKMLTAWLDSINVFDPAHPSNAKPQASATTASAGVVHGKEIIVSVDPSGIPRFSDELCAWMRANGMAPGDSKAQGDSTAQKPLSDDDIKWAAASTGKLAKKLESLLISLETLATQPTRVPESKSSVEAILELHTCLATKVDSINRLLTGYLLRESAELKARSTP